MDSITITTQITPKPKGWKPNKKRKFKIGFDTLLTAFKRVGNGILKRVEKLIIKLNRERYGLQ